MLWKRRKIKHHHQLSSFGRMTDARITSNVCIPITTPDRLRLKDSGRNTPTERVRLN